MDGFPPNEELTLDERKKRLNIAGLLTAYPDKTWTTKEVTENVDYSRSSVKRILDSAAANGTLFSKENVVFKERSDGEIDVEINKDHPHAKTVYELLDEERLERFKKEQRIDIADLDVPDPDGS